MKNILQKIKNFLNRKDVESALVSVFAGVVAELSALTSDFETFKAITPYVLGGILLRQLMRFTLEKFREARA